jgi:hypothetical protein
MLASAAGARQKIKWCMILSPDPDRLTQTVQQPFGLTVSAATYTSL